MKFNCWENSLLWPCVSISVKYKLLFIHIHTHSEHKSRPAFPSVQEIEYWLTPQAILFPLAPEPLRHVDLSLSELLPGKW